MGIFTFIRTYGLIFKVLGLVILIGGSVVSAYAYVSAHSRNKVLVETQGKTIEGLKLRIADLNARLVEENIRKAQRIKAAEDRATRNRELAEDAIADRDQIKAELAAVRKKTREEIKNDPEFAEWADDNIPAAAWRMLREANSGGGD